MTSIEASFSPPLRGVATTSIRYRAASFVERTGWWVNSSRNCRCLVTTPSARAKDAPRLLLIAQPPLLGEEGKRSIHNVRHRNSEPLYLVRRGVCAKGADSGWRG